MDFPTYEQREMIGVSGMALSTVVARIVLFFIMQMGGHEVDYNDLKTEMYNKIGIRSLICLAFFVIPYLSVITFLTGPLRLIYLIIMVTANALCIWLIWGTTKNTWQRNKNKFLNTVLPDEREMYESDYEHGLSVNKYNIMLGVSTITDSSDGRSRKLDTVRGFSLGSVSGIRGGRFYYLDIHFTRDNPIHIRLSSGARQGALTEARYIQNLLNIGQGYKYRKNYLTDPFIKYEFTDIENDKIRGIQANSCYQIFNAHKGMWALAKENPYSSIKLASWDMRPYEPDFLIRLQGLLLHHAKEAESSSNEENKYLIQLYCPRIIDISYISEIIEWNYGWHFNYDKYGLHSGIIYKEFERMLQCFGIFDQWIEYLNKYHVDCTRLAYIQSAYGRYFSIMWEFENEYILEERTKLEIIRKSRKKRMLGKTITKPQDWAEIRPDDGKLETKLGKLIQNYIIVAKTCTENQDALQKLDRLEQLFNNENWFTLCPHRPYVDIYDRLGDKWVQVCRIMDQIGMFDDFLKYICEDGKDPSKAEGIRRAIINRIYI